MVTPSGFSVGARVRTGLRLTASLLLLLPARSRDRFIGIGVALILAIAVGDWRIVEVERGSSFAAYETAGLNLTRGMNAQTSRTLGAVDKALSDIPAALELGAVENADQMKSALRAGAASDFLVDRQKRLQGVESLSLIDADGRLANSSPNGPRLEADFSKSELFIRLSAGQEAGPFVNAPASTSCVDDSGVDLMRSPISPVFSPRATLCTSRSNSRHSQATAGLGREVGILWQPDGSAEPRLP